MRTVIPTCRHLCNVFRYRIQLIYTLKLEKDLSSFVGIVLVQKLVLPNCFCVHDLAKIVCKFIYYAHKRIECIHFYFCENIPILRTTNIIWKYWNFRPNILKCLMFTYDNFTHFALTAFQIMFCIVDELYRQTTVVRLIQLEYFP